MAVRVPLGELAHAVERREVEQALLELRVRLALEDRRRGGVDARRVATREHDLRARRRQRTRRLEAEPGRRAGDDGDLAAEVDALEHLVGRGLEAHAGSPSSPGQVSGQSSVTLPCHCGARRSRNAITPSLASGLPIRWWCSTVSRWFDLVAVEIEARPQDPLAERHRHRRGGGGDIACVLPRSREHLVGGEHAIGDAEALHLVTVEGLAGEQDLGRVGHPDDARQRPVHERVAHHAPLRLHHAVLGVGGHEPEVALDRQRHAHADRVAVDRADHRLAHVPRREPQTGGVERGGVDLAERVTAAREVGAGAEGRRRARDHDRADAVVLVATTERVVELGAHARTERVAHFGPVECHRGDLLAHVEQQRLVGGCVTHVVSLGTS